MDREQARQEALRRVKRKKMGRLGQPSRKLPNSQMSMGDKFRLEQRKRLMNKRRDNLPGGMVAGAAVSVGVKNKDKIKKKISEIGNMKVKDAAKKIAGGVGALTPMGIAQRIGRAIQPKRKQDPVQPKRPRDMRERLKDIRKKIKEGKVKPIPMPKVKEMTPLGKMKKPRPGTYDYQLLQTQKPGYRVAPMLTGGQAKLDKNKNGKIDAQDFKILKAEKAKGRGMGLQDEKMKPGKVMKAALGAVALGKAVKSVSKKDNKKMTPGVMGGIGVNMMKEKAIRQILGRNKGGMGEAKGYKKYLQGLKKAEGSVFRAKYKAKQMATAGGRAALKAAKASRIGKIAAGVAAVGLGAKEFLKRKMEKRKRIKREKDAVRGLKEDAAVNVLKDQVKGLKKKMGGGMMMRRPMGNYMGGGLTEATQRLKAQGKMGGGMMMRPNPVGYKTGKSVKVKCKLGRNKPTKMY